MSRAAPPFSALRGGLRVGHRFFEREGLVAGEDGKERPRGLVDRAEDLAHPGIDVARLHPEVRCFLERTGELDLTIHSHFRAWFWPLWILLKPILWAIGQLVLPWFKGTIRTRVFAIDAARDGRASTIAPRAVVRRYVDSGATMQAVAYAVWRDGEVGYMSAAFPLTFSVLAGLLRLDPSGEDDQGRIGGSLTTSPDQRGRGEGGVWLATRFFSMRLPLGERLSLWAPGMRGAPSDLDPSEVPGAVLVGRHEQRLFGLHVVTHDYWFYRAEKVGIGEARR